MIVVLVTYERAVELFKKSRTGNQYVFKDGDTFKIVIDTGGSVPIYTEVDDDGSAVVQPFADFPSAIEVDGIEFTERIKFNV